MKRRIDKVAVIGSGIMGSGIACHFANIGVEVLLLDIAPNELNKIEFRLIDSLKLIKSIQVIFLAGWGVGVGRPQTTTCFSLNLRLK